MSLLFAFGRIVSEYWKSAMLDTERQWCIILLEQTSLAHSLRSVFHKM